GFIFILAFVFLISGSEAKSRRKNYVILKKGQTIWRIAKKYNTSVKYLCRINNIKDVTRVKAGSKIYIYKKSKKRITKKEYPRLDISLYFPVDGKIIKQFGQGDSVVQYNGIEIKGQSDTVVKASSSGMVKYAGTLRGYGKVIIVQYSSDISLVYAYLDKIYVERDQKVEKGQRIASLNNVNILHFELLKDGQAVDPTRYFKL
ncbi:MAG: peptidoglycan DD-metalloendopeptidase family protein, partial [Spirochaetes bacterium]|nr:peptidoglycan DD-metalloendopeptidase family protein [Spirochaetota bacterium]